MNTVKKMVGILIGVCFLSMSAPIMAIAGAGSGATMITRINFPANGSFLRVETQAPVVNPEGCEGADYYIVEKDVVGEEGFKQFVSLLTAAFLAKRSVHFWINGCTTKTYWESTRPVIHDIYIDQ